MPGEEKTFRDVMIFEERLRQNMIRLNRMRRRWELILASLVAMFAYFAYLTVYLPKREDPTNPYHLFGFILSSSILFIFFASGLYKAKLSTPAKFTSQCNRALKPYNVLFNRESKGDISFLRKVPQSFQEGYKDFKKRFREGSVRSTTPPTVKE
ncbi:hypothetical protein BC829DRAFT_387098 [Chytridium lagenaria]|nr:hypothetical protein BC829DRAFT_387098 [Chytridium lagenaria]